jgi:hypothetical protein
MRKVRTLVVLGISLLAASAVAAMHPFQLVAYAFAAEQPDRVTKLVLMMHSGFEQ